MQILAPKNRYTNLLVAKDRLPNQPHEPQGSHNTSIDIISITIVIMCHDTHNLIKVTYCCGLSPTVFRITITNQFPPPLPPCNTAYKEYNDSCSINVMAMPPQAKHQAMLSPHRNLHTQML